MNENYLKDYIPIVINVDELKSGYNTLAVGLRVLERVESEEEKKEMTVFMKNEILYPLLRKMKNYVRLLDFLTHYELRDYVEFRRGVFIITYSFQTNYKKKMRKLRNILAGCGLDEEMIWSILSYGNISDIHFEIKIDPIIYEYRKMNFLENVIDLKRRIIEFIKDFRGIIGYIDHNKPFQARLLNA